LVERVDDDVVVVSSRVARNLNLFKAGGPTDDSGVASSDEDSPCPDNFRIIIFAACNNDDKSGDRRISARLGSRIKTCCSWQRIEVDRILIKNECKSATEISKKFACLGLWCRGLLEMAFQIQ
jgi:hypothetical protein